MAGCTARSGGQGERWQQQEYEQQAQYAAPPPAQPPPPPPAPAPAPAAGAGGSDALTAEIERLAALRSQGLLTDEEFAAAKAKLLGL